jgi:hypothetical protein
MKEEKTQKKSSRKYEINNWRKEEREAKPERMKEEREKKICFDLPNNIA